MKKIILLTTSLSLLIALGCGGSQSLSSPRAYGSAEKEKSAEVTTATITANVEAEKKKEAQNSDFLNAVLDTNKKEKQTDSSEANQIADIPEKAEQSTRELVESVFYGSVDINDSSAAVDDDLWRQFDLAEEYHAMGVVANREAAWEEAQYYFEKSLKIMAHLDIEPDSSMTPEATKYTQILDNIISDYRIALRSLGNLTEDVSSAVLLERFGDLSARLSSDTMIVYQSEQNTITYDIPIVMNDRVKKSIVYFQTVAKSAFEKYLKRSHKYKPMMLRILREEGMPDDLIYLSLVESGYNAHAYSWARAMGLWQFISSTGRMYGLDRSWWFDERKDPEKSTRAAAKYLKHLYKQFGQWDLAMAAYNGGPGRVSRTIKKQKTIDFWKLRLKRETMDYVPLIMAATIICKNPEKYGFTDIEKEPEVVWDEVKIDKCLELKVIAREVGCSLKDLQFLNPELLRRYTPPNMKGYKLKLPVGSKTKFLAAYDAMPSPKETSWVKHKIRRGEAISTIASKYGVSQYAIMEANNLSRRSKIYAGKTLIVPVPLDRSYSRSVNKPSNRKAQNSVYAVRSGDTMWDIARAFGTSVEKLRRENSIVRGSRIYVGQKIKIPSSAKKLKKNNPTGSKPYASTKTTKSTKSSTKSKSQNKTYKVRSGDTLWDIARKYGTTTSALRKINGLGRSSRIYPGRVLKVTTNVKYVIHKVRRGETLSAIAGKYRTSIARIRANNNIDNPNRLGIGVELKIY